MGPFFDKNAVHCRAKNVLSVQVDDINMAGKTQNLEPIWNNLTNKVDLENPTTFLDQIYLGCTQRECKPNNCLVHGHRKMFE